MIVGIYNIFILLIIIHIIYEGREPLAQICAPSLGETEKL